MQHFSKLYLLTKQLQMKCQVAFVVLASNMQTSEIEKRMTEMYKQEFKMFTGRSELCNYLLDLLGGDGERKDFNIRCGDIHRIYNVGNGLASGNNKYMSVLNVP